MSPAPMQTALVGISLAVFANGPLFFIERRVFGLPGTWDGPVMQPVIVLTVAAAVVMIVTLQRPLVAAVPIGAAVALGVWAAMSTAWSLQPEQTLWKGLIYVGLPFVAWVIAGLDHDRLVVAFGWAGLTLVGISLVLVAAWPAAAIDRNGDWRGVMTGRNSLAPICGVAVIIALGLIAEGRRRPGVFLLALGLVGMFGAGSRTAWFALLIALGAASLAVLTRKRRAVKAAAGVGIVGAGFTLAAIGRFWNEPTLQQRRTIWDLVGDVAADARWHGVGWEAFWYTPALHDHALLRRGSAHGSIPELLLGVGVIGLVLWLVVVGFACVGVARTLWRAPGAEAWTWAALVAFLVVENLTESFVLWFSYNWVLLTAAALRFGPGPRLSLERRTDVPSAVATS
ncbi:MAG: O-antigen ligase family protein [Acidimicrobiales bacterium]